jgi:hypothetical protein
MCLYRNNDIVKRGETAGVRRGKGGARMIRSASETTR